MSSAELDPYLDLDPDPALWLIGPTPERPVEQWLPAATDAVVSDFGRGAEQAREREHVRDVLGLTARRHPSPLPLFVLRWRELREVPMALFLGLVEREPGLTDLWLDAEDGESVEPPVREPVPTGAGTTIERSLSYTHDGETGLTIGLRYVVDTGHPVAVVLAHTASDSPGDILAAASDVEDLLRTVRVLDQPPSGGRR
ncbi:hypothetical protein [Nocardioides pakistanensis]